MSKQRKKLRNRKIEDKRLNLWLPAEQTGYRRIITGDLEKDETYKRKSSNEKALLKVLKLNHKNNS